MDFKVPDLRKHRAVFGESEVQGQTNAMNSTETAEHGSMTDGTSPTKQGGCGGATLAEHQVLTKLLCHCSRMGMGQKKRCENSWVKIKAVL